MEISFIIKPFQDLTLHELYAVLALRQEVFVVEQNCVFQDADGNDFKAWHLLGYNNEQKLVAYTRLFNENDSYEKYLSIGRVVTSPKARTKGLGKLLMATSIREVRRLFGEKPIKIGSQIYLDRFYESFGFRSVGETYMEDGIEHRYMILD